MTPRGGILAACALGLMVAGNFAAAKAPKTSLRPVTREDVFPLPKETTQKQARAEAPSKSLRPRLRPSSVTRAAVAQPAAAVAAASTANVVKTKPAKAAKTQAAETKTTRVAMATGRDAVETGVNVQRKKRSRLPEGMSYLCKSKNIIGKAHAPVPAKLPGCGIKSGAVKVYQVGEVSLSTPAVMTCDTAFALHRWVDKGVADSVKHFGGGVSKLKVAAGYACRTRNNRPGAKVSEHGRGKAIDISALYTKSGDEISVLRDWGKGKKGRMLREMHRSACGPFGTVLGPNADRYHRDHFHFDVASHRSGPYCR
ncbi:hypothetical protein BXY66_0156 [Shimia isoporae]|uniref:Extensin-like C-terminal domain-containing protein n=1 Tax=Shimia isoporae TaxID=647720 RepID=A0A4R1NNJ5_9RHOB|nr:extensin family protein [Shimia isoporae]TCL08123.1 hypothetical protein BXY66_0156 [Shimia isoporae]